MAEKRWALVPGGWPAARKLEGLGEREEIRTLLRRRLEAGLVEAAVLVTPASQDTEMSVFWVKKETKRAESTDIGMLPAWSRARTATCGRGAERR